MSLRKSALAESRRLFTRFSLDGAIDSGEPEGGAVFALSVHPGAKLLCALAFIVTVVSFPSDDLAGVAAMSFYPALMLTLFRVSALSLLRRSLPALPFALALGISSALFQRTPLWLLGDFVLTSGMVSGLSLVLKTLLSVSALSLLSLATPPRLLLAALTRAGLPKLLALQLSMTGRYIALLAAEAAAMLTAYQLRSRRRVNGVSLRDSGSFLGQLLLRSLDRAGRVYDAMCLRGFGETDGAFSSPEDAARWTLKDTAFTLTFSGAVVLTRLTRPLALFAAWAASLAGGQR